jgi:hypothetical protein
MPHSSDIEDGAGRREEQRGGRSREEAREAEWMTYGQWKCRWSDRSQGGGAGSDRIE